MRAEQKVMLVVTALGLYALYRLTRASSSVPETEDQTGRTRTADQNDASLPLGPGVAAQPPEGLQWFAPSLVGPLPVRGGGWYKGRIETTRAEGLSPQSRDADVVRWLGQVGLSEARVFRTPADGAGTIQPFALANAGQGTRWFWARVPALEPKHAWPEGLVLLWLAKAPTS